MLSNVLNCSSPFLYPLLLKNGEEVYNVTNVCLSKVCTQENMDNLYCIVLNCLHHFYAPAIQRMVKEDIVLLMSVCPWCALRKTWITCIRVVLMFVNCLHHFCAPAIQRMVKEDIMLPTCQHIKLIIDLLKI